MTVIRILVTGSRNVTVPQAAHVRHILRRACAETLASGGTVTVVQGECPHGGVDFATQLWAESTPGVISEGHPADWKRHGKAAGPLRNSHMVDLGADLCLAFPAPDSVGTWDCLTKAAKAGIHTRIHPLVVATKERQP